MGDLNDNAIFNENESLNNSTSQPSFPENALPHTVDDNARALMAAVKRDYDRANGQVVVSGTANAIILTYPVSPYLCLKGDRYAFAPTLTNTGATLITIGALPPYEIVAYGVSLTGGELVADIPIELVFDGTNFQFMGRPQGGTLGNGTGTLHFANADIGAIAATSVAATTIAGTTIASTGMIDAASVVVSHLGSTVAQLDNTGLVMTGTLAVTGNIALNGLTLRDATPTIESFGGVADGVTDNSAAFAAALAASPAGKPCVRFGPGRYMFAAQVVVSVADDIAAALSIGGEGLDVTEIYFPNASGGFAITFLGQGGSIYLHDLSLLTAQIGTATAVAVTGPNAAALAPEPGPMSVFSNLMLRSSATYLLSGGSTTAYWSNGFALTRVSNVTWNTVTQIGHINNAGYSSLGTGIVVGGGTSNYIPCIFNVINCQFLAVGTGFTYGDFAQGVFILNSNFVACTQGISVPANQTNLDQLIINGSQFNCSAAGIGLSSNMVDLLVADSLFLSPLSAVGINIAGGVQLLRSAITGCSFGGTAIGVGTGIAAAAGSSGDISLTGCGFKFLASDFNFASTASGWNVANNHGDIVFTNLNPANIIDWPQDFSATLALTFGGASTGITYLSKTAVYSRRGKEVWIDLEIYLTSKGSATGIAILTGLPVAAAGYNFACPVYTFNMTGLPSHVSGLVDGSAATITVAVATATGNAATTDAVFTNTSQLTCSAHYRVV